MTLELRHWTANAVPELLSATLGALLWVLLLAPRSHTGLAGLFAIAILCALLRSLAWGAWLILRGPEVLVTPFGIPFGPWARGWLASSAFLAPLLACLLASWTLDVGGRFVWLQSLLLSLAGASAAILWSLPRSRIALREAGLAIATDDVRSRRFIKPAALTASLVFALTFGLARSAAERSAQRSAQDLLDERAAWISDRSAAELLDRARSWRTMGFAEQAPDGPWQSPVGGAAAWIPLQPDLPELRREGLLYRIFPAVSTGPNPRPARLLIVRPEPIWSWEIGLGAVACALATATLVWLWLSDQARLERDAHSHLLAGFRALAAGDTRLELDLASEGEAEGEEVFKQLREYLRALHRGLELLAHGSHEIPTTLEGPGFRSLRKLVDRTRGVIEAMDQESQSFDELGKQVLANALKTEKDAQRQAKRFEQLGEMATRLTQDSTRIASSGQDIYESARKNGDTARSLTSNVAELHSQTTRIRDIISGIERISKQSRMLALNIEIESRKGTTHAADKGFTAIAGEARRLSDEVHSATVVATDLLAEIDKALASAREAVDGNNNLVSSTLAIAQEITRTTHEQTKTARALNSRLKKTAEDIKDGADAVQRARQNIEKLTQRSKDLTKALQPLRGDASASNTTSSTPSDSQPELDSVQARLS